MKKLETVSVDSEAEFQCFEGLENNYVQIKITGIMPYNKDKVTVFNLNIDSLDLLTQSLLKFKPKKN
jgi:hypothetical protein